MVQGEQSPPPTVEPASDDELAQVRALLHALGPVEFVLLTRARIEQALEGAVARGRLTSRAAAELVADLLARGREEIEIAATDVRRRLPGAAVGEGALGTTDHARSHVPSGPGLPIAGYDDLTAAQIAQRLPGLTPVELRRALDHERRHGNRKTVLAAIERALA